MKLYGYSRSRSLRPLWALEEAGVAYDYHSVDFQKGEHRSAEFLALNPGGKVPALIDGDLALTESAAIVTYIGSKYAPQLVPQEATEKAKYDQWCYFVIAELEQGLWTMGKHKFALPAEQRIKEIFPTAVWEHQKALGLLAEGLGDKPYILGDEFSAADILVAHTLGWGLAFEQPLEQENLSAYYERQTQRSAYQAAIDKISP